MSFYLILTCKIRHAFLLGSNSHMVSVLYENERNSTLVFNPIKEDDIGDYECVADNGIGETLEKTITVLVHGKENICFLIYRESCNVFCFQK